MAQRKFDAALALDEVDDIDLGPALRRLPPAEVEQLDEYPEPERVDVWPAYLMIGLLAVVCMGLALVVIATR